MAALLDRLTRQAGDTIASRILERLLPAVATGLVAAAFVLNRKAASDEAQFRAGDRKVA